MSTIDEIRQLQQQGYNDDEVTQKLMEAGYSPKEINYSLSQSRIKSAVVDNVQASMINQEMQPSALQSEQPNTQLAAPQPQEQYQEYYQPQQQTQEYYPQQSGASTETITEIAEQIMAEKLIEVKKVINSMVEFKSVMDAKVTGLDERLKRIESIISNLQASIIGKIGGFGKGIEEIKEEMTMMQDSFSKMINPIARRAINQQQEEPEQQETREEKQQLKKNKKPGFEDFLR